MPALSKVYERLILQQQLQFVDAQKLYADRMSGFRKGHSTATLLMGMRDDILRAMKKGEVTLMVMADFSRAFDTTDFKTILRKLHALNFSKDYLTWMTNYLTDRHQFVQINGCK